MLRLYLYARVRLHYAQMARGTAGAACTRSSLRPLTFEEGEFEANSGDQRREIANAHSVVVTREGG